jgi:hypothetical protein
LVFLHFAYMHRTFVYGGATQKDRQTSEADWCKALYVATDSLWQITGHFPHAVCLYFTLGPSALVQAKHNGTVYVDTNCKVLFCRLIALTHMFMHELNFWYTTLKAKWHQFLGAV